jgi:flagellar biosynthesis protein
VACEPEHLEKPGGGEVSEPKKGQPTGVANVDHGQAGADAAQQPAERGRAKAVAIKDTSQSGTLPRLVASGHGAIAEQILQIAWANDIKVREDADLIEVLSAIDIDSEIPIEAFAAVAEILSYVYRANAGEIPMNEGPFDSPQTTSSEPESPNDAPNRPA